MESALGRRTHYEVGIRRTDYGVGIRPTFFPTPLKPHCQGRVMGFVGDGGSIAIATALPPSFVYFIVSIK